MTREKVTQLFIFSEKSYQLIGGTIGYVLCPISILELGVPLYLHASATWRLSLGWTFLVAALLIFLCNVYLSCRKELLQTGASIFPVVFSLSAIPALLLLGLDMSFWGKIGGAVVSVALDFVGQNLIGGAISDKLSSQS